MKNPTEVRIIKKYQNRRLYDTATSTYIILDDIKQMIIAGDLIQVIDAKTSQDVSRSVLLQIILDEEANHSTSFSNEFLLQIIRFYGKTFQPALSPYLDNCLDILCQMQKRFYAQIKSNYPKEAIPATIELWQDFFKKNGSQIQSNIFNYLSDSTAHFMKIQENSQQSSAQPQFRAHAENFLNLMQFSFQKITPKK